MAPLPLIVEETDMFITRAIKDDFLQSLRQLVERAAEVEFVVHRQGLKQGLVIVTGTAVPRCDRSLTQ